MRREREREGEGEMSGGNLGKKQWPERAAEFASLGAFAACRLHSYSSARV